MDVIEKYGEEFYRLSTEEDKKIVSFKKDQNPYEIREITETITYKAYFFKDGTPVDCFHRLTLSVEELELMREVVEAYREEPSDPKGKMSEKEWNAIFDPWFMDRLFPTTDALESYDWYKMPYRRSPRYAFDEDGECRFLFHDDDYAYEVRRAENGWLICCRQAPKEHPLMPHMDEDEPKTLREVARYYDRDENDGYSISLALIRKEEYEEMRPYIKEAPKE
jgi:hypothetical protein